MILRSAFEEDEITGTCLPLWSRSGGGTWRWREPSLITKPEHFDPHRRRQTTKTSGAYAWVVFPRVGRIDNRQLKIVMIDLAVTREDRLMEESPQVWYCFGKFSSGNPCFWRWIVQPKRDTRCPLCKSLHELTMTGTSTFWSKLIQHPRFLNWMRAIISPHSRLPLFPGMWHRIF